MIYRDLDAKVWRTLYAGVPLRVQVLIRRLALRASLYFKLKENSKYLPWKFEPSWLYIHRPSPYFASSSSSTLPFPIHSSISRYIVRSIPGIRIAVALFNGAVTHPETPSLVFKLSKLKLFSIYSRASTACALVLSTRMMVKKKLNKKIASQVFYFNLNFLLSFSQLNKTNSHLHVDVQQRKEMLESKEDSHCDV